MIKVIADTTAGLSPEVIDRYQIPVLPQIVVFGNQSYRDDTEMTSEEFLSRLCTSAALPKTAAPPPALYTPIYEKYLAAGYSVLVITPTSEASGTARSAMTAAGDFPEADIRVFDSRTVAGPLASMVIAACAWAEQNLDLEAIVTRLKDMVRRHRVYFVVDTLEFLYKGGRIGGAQHLLGNLLQVKPILTLRDGRVEVLEQQRTQRRALDRLRELVLTQCPSGEEALLSVMHAGDRRSAEILAQEFGDRLHLKSIPIYSLPPAIIVHGGPGILAAGFFTADPA